MIINNNYNGKIIVYGAGYCGLMFLDLLKSKGVNPCCFFDSQKSKSGLIYDGVSIYYPAYKDDYKEYLVVICILDFRKITEIKNYLLNLGYRNIISVYDLCNDEALFRNQKLIFNVPEAWLDNNDEKIKEVRRMLADELSVKTFDSILLSLYNRLEVEIPSFALENQYFAYDLFSKCEDEIFLDCGAFKGDVLRYFCNFNKLFKHYYAVEPDCKNYCRIELLKEAEDDRVSIIKCAVSDCNEKLRIKNYLNENSVISETGDLVEAHSLDDICRKYGIEPTFVKIDIEGYEAKLFRGGEYTIKKYQPTIACAIYHKIDDLVDLPILIHTILPNHKLFIRSYMNINETILYAVNPERGKNEVS